MPNANNAANATSQMEPLSLYTCCCSSRNDKNKKESAIMVEDSPEPTINLNKPKYEFGHATHYTHSVTSPRLLCEFE
jgi:hypothetical protein